MLGWANAADMPPRFHWQQQDEVLYWQMCPDYYRDICILASRTVGILLRLIMGYAVDARSAR